MESKFPLTRTQGEHVGYKLKIGVCCSMGAKFKISEIAVRNCNNKLEMTNFLPHFAGV